MSWHLRVASFSIAAALALPALAASRGTGCPVSRAGSLPDAAWNDDARTTLPRIVAALGEAARHCGQAEGADTEPQAHARQALQALAAMDLAKASRGLNEALQLDATNSSLHFFNGFVYHLQARQGDREKTDLAIEGYRQALRFEPSNWIASEFLGLALMEQRQYPAAQSAFADALLVHREDPVLMARLLAASYLSGDAPAACAMADRLADGASGSSPGFQRSAAAVYSACGRFDRAAAQRERFASDARGTDDLAAVDARIAQWRDALRVRTQFVPPAGTPPPLRDDLAATAVVPQDGFVVPGAVPQPLRPGLPAAPVAPGATPRRMVLVDVVLVRTEDSITTSRGVNLLNALSLQFGSATAPAFSHIVESNGSASSTLLNRTVTVPALVYSLNLANANSSLNEVLARPTLAAVEGMKSEFFSGTSLNAAVVSSGSVGAGSVALEKRYGVRLGIVPQILPDGMIQLSIDAARTFLKPPSANIGFTYKLEISEILANANVVMRMGDTLVLGGLSEKESTTNRDGVPGLQDVPGVQYLFSQQSRTDFQRSVLILITPRPAAYTWRADAAPGAAAEPASNGMDVLRARYGDWFSPYPNLASVFNQLNRADLYREFRTADVTLERWDRMDTTRQRLEQALGFLYY